MDKDVIAMNKILGILFLKAMDFVIFEAWEFIEFQSGNPDPSSSQEYLPKIIFNVHY